MNDFQPDYRHIEAAARNRLADRMPLYEHIINVGKVEQITNKSIAPLIEGTLSDRREFFRHFSSFFRHMGYDTVSFEACIVTVISNGEALSGHIPGPIQNRVDLERFPFQELPERFWNAHYDSFVAFRDTLPEGMKGIGGIGNGVFEIAQDLVGFEPLCLLKAEDPDVYTQVFQKTGDLMYTIWQRFVQEFGDDFVLPRFGDDLGFKSATLLHPDDIRTLIIPQYQRIVDLVHAAGKPFLLHSCGNIFEVMDDIIEGAGIDAKHSNEDQIAPFSVWLQRYGERIGNFGGVDMDVLCQKSPEEIADYTTEVVQQAEGHGGFALGSGNSIPEYVPTEGYLAMVETGRRLRGDYD
jgi:uroporphyrinogen decarboxylase